MSAGRHHYVRCDMASIGIHYYWIFGHQMYALWSSSFTLFPEALHMQYRLIHAWVAHPTSAQQALPSAVKSAVDCADAPVDTR
jgi:hypothetical protein